MQLVCLGSTNSCNPKPYEQPEERKKQPTLFLPTWPFFAFLRFVNHDCLKCTHPQQHVPPSFSISAWPDSGAKLCSTLAFTGGLDKDLTSSHGSWALILGGDGIVNDTVFTGIGSHWGMGPCKGGCRLLPSFDVCVRRGVVPMFITVFECTWPEQMTIYVDLYSSAFHNQTVKECMSFLFQDLWNYHIRLFLKAHYCQPTIWAGPFFSMNLLQYSTFELTPWHIS